MTGLADILAAPKNASTSEQYFIHCAELLSKDGYSTGDIKDGLVNASLSLANTEGGFLPFLTVARQLLLARSRKLSDLVLGVDSIPTRYY